MEDARELGAVSSDGTHYWNGEAWGWQLLWLTATDVLAAARARFGRGPDSATFLASGLLNQSWRLGSEYVLRISRSELTDAHIRYEHLITRRLHERIDGVVAPLAGIDGATIQLWNGRIVSLFPFVAGVSGADVERAECADAAVDLVAEIHRVSPELGLPQRPGVIPFDRRDQHPWGWVRPVLERDLPGARDLIAAVDREVIALDRWFDGQRDRQFTYGLVHGDVNPRNLIFGGDRVALIDWDGCRLDPVITETAGLVCSAPDPDRAWRRYLAAGGPLTEADHEQLPPYARMDALGELQYAVDDGRASPTAMAKLEWTWDQLSET